MSPDVTGTDVDPGIDAMIPTGEPVSRVIVSRGPIVGESVIVFDPDDMDWVSSISEGTFGVSREEDVEGLLAEGVGEDAGTSSSKGSSAAGEEASVGDEGAADLSEPTTTSPFCFLAASALRA